MVFSLVVLGSIVLIHKAGTMERVIKKKTEDDGMLYHKRSNLGQQNATALGQGGR